MDLKTLETKISNLTSNFDESGFIYDLMAVYDFPKSTVALLRKDPNKLSIISNQIILRNKFVFHKTKDTEDVHEIIDGIQKSERIGKYKPRFIIVTDFTTFLAVDTKTSDTLDIEFGNLSKHCTFFLPWIGMEKVKHSDENPADIKAASEMAKLYDQLIADNPDFSREHPHDLNCFLTRLLFCFFAEDSGIFPKGLFSGSLASYTAIEGTGLNIYLHDVFQILNTPNEKRNKCPAHLIDFPYVNGGLFKDEIILPNFTRKSRETIVSAGKLIWSDINPDIFGSMIQAVAHPGIREDLGMHYTSVLNIMKVLEPLFIDELKEEISKATGNVKKLSELRRRISDIKVFDPACGSGNFLVIAYKELCKLEQNIIEKIQEVGGTPDSFSNISLNSFFGIEIDGFACEVAKLSLWLAQHQMNRNFADIFGMMKPTLPLKESGQIHELNSIRTSWEYVCPHLDESGNSNEIYVVGNPPYEGSRKQKEDQKADLKYLFIKDYKSLDYIAAWFYKGATYINCGDKVNLALVSTNSIVQGEQVALLWPLIFDNGVEISFAHQSFKWRNLAKNNAGVTCVIIGLRKKSDLEKRIYSEKQVTRVKNITPYLTEGHDVIITRRPTPLSSFLPPMIYGNMPLENNHLKLTTYEREKLIQDHPEAVSLIRPLIGGDEFLKGTIRYCLWIGDENLKLAQSIPFIKDRISKVAKFRETAGDVARGLVTRSHQFRYRHEAKKHTIIIPRTSSENRDYLQCGFVDKKFITLDSIQVIYDSEIYVFGIIASSMHMLWTKAVGGRLQTGIRYSSALCYNTFPVPVLTDSQKRLIEIQVMNILDEREKYPEMEIGELYNRTKMPLGLKQAHKFLDEVVESLYQRNPFDNDEQRLACLIKLYENMIKLNSK